MLKRFIEQLVSELKLQTPEEPKAGSAYEMKFAPNLEVKMFENPEGIIKLFVVLCPLPTEKQNEYLHFAMGSNLFGRETGRNFLGLDKDEKSVTLTRFVDKEAEYHEFKQALEEFLNYAETWRADTKAYVG